MWWDGAALFKLKKKQVWTLSSHQSFQMCVIINALTVPVWEWLVVEFHFDTNSMQCIFTEHIPAILKLPASNLLQIYQQYVY